MRLSSMQMSTKERKTDMANLCDFSIKIRGTKASCEKWLALMESYEKEQHFYRMEDVYVSEADGTEEEYFMVLHGCCAWSLETCCRASGYSEGVDLFAVHTKELNLVMEAWGEETGMGFQEHYIYQNGICLTDECADYYEYFWDREAYPAYEDLKKDNPDAPEESAFIEDVAGVGGINGYGEWNMDQMFSEAGTERG